MNRPTWATIVGILAIVFGGFGVLGGAQEMAMPSMLEMQKEMMTNFGQENTVNGEKAPNITLEVEKDGEKQSIEVSNVFKSMGKHFEFPDWYKSWAVAFGLVSMLLSALYFLSGIFLLMIKKYAINVFYGAIGASMLWAIMQSVIYYKTGSGMLMAQIPMFVASVIIDIVLLVVVLVGAKEAFVESNDLG